MWLLLVPTALAEPTLSGRFVLSEQPDALASKHTEAVEAAMSALPWAFRPIARPKLQKAVKNCGKLEVALDPEAFQVRCDADDLFRRARGDSGTITGEDGKQYEVVVQVGEDRITMQFTGDEGGQRSIYVPQPDGSLLLTKELFSKWLPTPVSWTVRYAAAP